MFRNDFYGEISKKYPFDKKQAFWPKSSQNASIGWYVLLENHEYGETEQKLKVGWKRQKL